MKFCCLSDLHGVLPHIPACDAVLIAGDICPCIKGKQQLAWLDRVLKKWLESLDRPVFCCAGNHDWPMYCFPEEVKSLNLPWTYLQDSSATFNGLNIYGTPHSLIFYNWAFNLTEHELMGKWNLIPDDTDILICHSPPKYYGDMVDGRSAGSESLLWRIQQLPQLKLCCFGHIHEGRGEWKTSRAVLANVSIMDEHYKPTNPLFFIDI